MKSMMQVVLALSIAAAPALAQTPSPSKPPAAPEPPVKIEAPRPPDPPGQPLNIRFDVTIVDEGGPQTSRKAISVTVADREIGLVRASVSIPGHGDVPVSLDVRPALGSDGKIRTRMVLEYRPTPAFDPKGAVPTPASMRLQFGVLLENGEKIVAAQAADPVTDRRVSVEVVATILK
jgi:hypothetical protein